MIIRNSLFQEIILIVLVVNVLQNVTAGPTKRSSRMVREVYPEIEPESDGNQAQVCIVGDVVYGVDEPVPAEQPCLKCRCQPPGVQCETIKCAKKPGCKAIHRPNKCCPDYQCECHHEGRIYANGERLKTPPGGECKVCYCRGGEVQCAEVSCYIRTDCEAKTVPGQCCPKYDHCPPKEPLMERPTINTAMVLPNLNQQSLELWPITRLLQNSTESPNNETQETNKIDNNFDDEENLTITTHNTIQLPKTTPTGLNKQIETPKITIHEIIPEIKEIPITQPIVRSPEDTKINDVVTDSDADSSEILEVFQQPPPVLRIGDKLLFLKQGELVNEKDASTPSSVITIIGAEGLQRGFEDSGEHDSGKTDEHALFNNSNDLEPKASESTHILSLVKKRVTSTTETAPKLTSTEESSTVSSEETYTTIVDETENSTALLYHNQTEILEINSMETTTTTSDDVIELKNTTNIFDENPAYPPIPDVMSPDIDNFTKAPEAETKILGQVLEIRNNKTIPENATYGEWLKNENLNESLVNSKAALPDEILNLNQTEELTTTDEVSSYTASELEVERSMESIEESSSDSRELTTPKNNHASIVSNESASVETTESGDHSESGDMLKIPSSTEISKIDDVEIINSDKTENPVIKDVEIINDSRKVEKILELPAKSIEKRENSKQDVADEVFRELESELNPDATEKYQTDDEDSDKIFQQLLEDTSTPKSTKKLTKDEETLQRVSDAIARITLGGHKNKSFDFNILGVLSNFFSGNKQK